MARVGALPGQFYIVETSLKPDWKYMPRVKVHYDGWIALPADSRHRLGIKTGDRLELEWVDGGLMIRSSSAPAPAPAHQQDVVQSPVPVKSAVQKRRTLKPKATPRPQRSAKLAGAILPKTAGRKKAAAKA